MGEPCMPCVITSIGAFSGASIYFWTLRRSSFGRIPAMVVSGSFAALGLYRIYTHFTADVENGSNSGEGISEGGTSGGGTVG